MTRRHLGDRGGPVAFATGPAQAPRRGGSVTQSDDGFRVVQYERPKACNVATLPFPGFPTDLQPMAIAMAAIADGTSMITENVFEARFRFVEEMIRLGADARIKDPGHHAVVRRGSRRSCRVQAGVVFG